jgi:hypothetical protein
LTEDLTVAKDVTTTNTSASAVILNAAKSTAAGTATGGNVVLTGSRSISAGVNGTVKVYTGELTSTGNASSLVSQGQGRFRYNADEATDFSSGTWTDLDTGTYVIYREQPSAAITGGPLSMVYGDAMPSLAATGGVNGDVPTVDVADRQDSTAGHINAGTYSLSSNLVGLGYSVTGLSLTVAPKDVTLTSITAADKTYDGTTTASITSGVISGTVGEETLAISGSGSFDDKNAGLGKTVTVDDATELTRTDGTGDWDNYNLTTTELTTTAAINKKEVTLTSITAADKTYDGNTTASITAGVISGTVGEETLAISGTGSFGDKNAGSGKTVTVADVTQLTPADGTGDWDNYNLTTTGSMETQAAIDIKDVTLTINNASKKPRDPEPIYSFEAEPDSTDLYLAEFIFTRDPGDRPGTYLIRVSNNPNFTIKLSGEAVLEIEAEPTRSGGELANDVANNPATQVVTGFKMPSMAVNPSARVSSAGVQVEMVQRPALQTAGLVTVSVPADASDNSAGLAFALPNELLGAISNAVNVEATLAGGQPLPSWLRFDSTNGQFVIGDVADVSFPLEINVQLGTQAVTVVISERSN